MTINRSERGIDNALLNEFRQLRRDFDEYKSTPQPIGNGSLNWATFVAALVGPYTLAAGESTVISVLFMSDGGAFTYNGKPAINRITSFDPVYTIAVDTNASTHYFPYGASLTTAQKKLRSSWWCDWAASGFTETNGERYINIHVTNTDSSSHNYYVYLSGLIPRPALKPQ